jgi:hypothetical protein
MMMQGLRSFRKSAASRTSKARSEPKKFHTNSGGEVGAVREKGEAHETTNSFKNQLQRF